VKNVVGPVLLLAALALSQDWIVEQVDPTAAAASPVELVKAADGRLWACYRTAAGFMRAACLGDSGWSLTDICWGYVPTNVWRPFFAASPHGELCLSCVTGDSGWLFRLVGDSWQGEPYSFAARAMCGTVAYDTAGRLHTAFVDTAGDFCAGHETDSGWTAGFVARLSIEGPDHGDAACFTVAPDCRPWYFAYVWWMKPPQLWGEEASLMHFSGDSWTTVWN